MRSNILHSVVTYLFVNTFDIRTALVYWNRETQPRPAIENTFLVWTGHDKKKRRRKKYENVLEKEKKLKYRKRDVFFSAMRTQLWISYNYYSQRLFVFPSVRHRRIKCLPREFQTLDDISRVPYTRPKDRRQ